MTYHKKGLQPQSPGLFYWVLEEKIKVEGRVGDSPFFFFFSYLVVWKEVRDLGHVPKLRAPPNLRIQMGFGFTLSSSSFLINNILFHSPCPHRWVQTDSKADLKLPFTRKLLFPSVPL